MFTAGRRCEHVNRKSVKDVNRGKALAILTGNTPKWGLMSIAGTDWRPLDQNEANCVESRLVKPIFSPLFDSDDFCPGISENLHLGVVLLMLPFLFTLVKF